MSKPSEPAPLRGIAAPKPNRNRRRYSAARWRLPRRGMEACTIAQFCALYGISPSYYWKLQALGMGPRVLKLGGRRFITRQAANDWLQAMEVESARAAAATTVVVRAREAEETTA